MQLNKLKTFILLIGFSLLFSCSEEQNDFSLIPVNADEKWGYINHEGKYIINPQFKSANVFSNGLALVQESSEKGLLGFINKEGIYIIKPSYKYATSFSDGFAWVTPELSYPLLINTKGETIFELKNSTLVYAFSEGLAAFRNENDLFGFVSTDGKVVINPQFSFVGKFSEGLCAVGDKNGSVGFINKKGELVINYQFKNVEHSYRDDNTYYLEFKFLNGECSVLGQNQKFGIINKEAKYLVNPQYDYLHNNSNGMYSIYSNNKCGWIDINNKTIINPQFESFSNFNSEGLAPVISSGTKYGYIDMKGKMIINPQFDEAGPFIGDLAAIRIGDKFGFIDTKGSMIINPQFDRIAKEFQNTQLLESENYVLSDFIDCKAILKLVNPKKEISIKDDRLSDNLGRLFKKYSLNINTIPYHDLYLNEIKFVTGNTINNNFYIDYSAKFLKTQEYNYAKIDPYGRPEITAALNEKPIELSLKINLMGIAQEKEEAIINILTKAFPYKLDTRSSLLNKIFIIDNENVLIVRKNSSNVILISLINKKYLNPDAYYYNFENQGGNSSYQDNMQVDSSYAYPDTLYRR